MRENPKWRERNRHVQEAHNLIDDLGALKLQMGQKYPKWMQKRIDDILRGAWNLIYPLQEYRKEVPQEIED